MSEIQNANSCGFAIQVIAPQEMSLESPQL